MFSAESAAVFAFVVLLLVVNLTVRMHLASKQNAREHAELRKANDRNAEAIIRQAEATDRRFDSINRKLDQILSLLRNRSDKEDGHDAR